MSDLLRRLSEDLYEYCPGNCTRYMILATRIQPSKYDPASLAFMWLYRGDRGGSGMLIPKGEVIDLAYFKEKTDIKNTADAVPLLCFLAEYFDVKVSGIPHEYNNQPWFVEAKARVAGSERWFR